MTPDHPYLRKKRLTMSGCYGLRVSESGNLIIPMFRVSTSKRVELCSVQKISATGEKKFAYGAPSKWARFWIERPRSTVTVLCEGFATGATIFESLPTCRVCVCFSASNLVAVAEREDWSGLVAVAADFDRWTQETHGKNPGREAGEKAAKAIGCGCAFPEHIDGTDWNDAFVERLEKLEAAEEFQPRKTPAHRLRRTALAPIADAIMRAAKFVR